MAHLGTTFDATTVEPEQAVRARCRRGNMSGADRRQRDAADQGRPRPVPLARDRRARGPLRRAQAVRPAEPGQRQPETVEIAQRTLSAICHATGRMQVQDSERAAPDPDDRRREGPAAEERLRREQQGPLPAAGRGRRRSRGGHAARAAPAQPAAPRRSRRFAAPWKRSTRAWRARPGAARAPCKRLIEQPMIDLNDAGAAPRCLPTAAEACRARLAELRATTSPRSAPQIAAARPEAPGAAARRSTADWFHRAKTALRHPQRERAELRAHMATLPARRDRAEGPASSRCCAPTTTMTRWAQRARRGAPRLQRAPGDG